MNGISALIRRDMREMMRTQQKGNYLQTSQRALSPDSEYASTLTLDFLASRTVR